MLKSLLNPICLSLTILTALLVYLILGSIFGIQGALIGVCAAFPIGLLGGKVSRTLERNIREEEDT